jgi:hypothetical protein
MRLARESTNQGLACKHTHTWLTPIYLPSPHFIMHYPYGASVKNLVYPTRGLLSKIEPLLAPSLIFVIRLPCIHGATAKGVLIEHCLRDIPWWRRMASAACYMGGSNVRLVSVGLDASPSPRWYPNVMELFCFVRKKMWRWSGFTSLVDS